MLSAKPIPQSEISFWKSWSRLELGVLVGSICLALQVIAFVSFSQWRGYQDTIKTAELNTRNLVHVIATNAEQGIKAIDLNLATTEEVFRNWPSGKPIAEPQLNWLLRGRLKLMPSVRSLGILNRNGNLMYVAGAAIAPVGTPLAYREYFQWHRDNESKQVRVGAPEMGISLNTLFIPVSRRLIAPDGSFDGVIVAAMEPRFLRDFYASFDTGSQGIIAILLRDTTMLARAPNREDLIGKKLPNLPLFRDHFPLNERGTYRAKTLTDGVPRVTSYEPVAGTDMIALVGFSESELLAGWRDRAIMRTFGTILILLAIGVLAYMLIKGLTRQRALDEDLRASEARYRHMIATATEGIWQFDGADKTTYVNPFLTRMLGYDESDLLGKMPSEFVWAEDVAHSEEMSEKRKQGTANTQYDLRFRRKDGSALLAIVSVGSTFDAEGNYTGGLAMLTDITARAKAEYEAFRHVMLLEVLRNIDTAILGAASKQEIATIGLDGISRLIPHWGARLLTFDFETGNATMLTTDLEVHPGVEIPLSIDLDMYGREDIARMRAGEEIVVQDVSTLAAPSKLLQNLIENGMRSFVRLPMQAEGELIGALNIGFNTVGAIGEEQVVIIRTIAKQMAVAIRQTRLRKQVEKHTELLEQRVAERTAELEVVNQELESFTSAVTHDLRAPVRNINGLTMILLEEKEHLNTEAIGHVIRISKAARRMETLISDLLSLARTSTREVRKQVFSMNKLAQDLQEDLPPGIGARRIEWKIEAMPDAVGDPELISIVMQNLLANAVKYSSKRDDPVIEVGSRINSAGKTEYFVRDNGAGFDMQYVGRLFHAFTRLHADKEFEGTGVGLATVQRIIHRHGGSVHAEGKPGEGAEFSFTLG